MEMKTCTLCQEELPLDEFRVRRGKPESRCKVCQSDLWRLHDTKRKNRAMSKLLNWPAPAMANKND